VVAPIVVTPIVDTPIVVVTLSSISLAPATSSVIVGATDQITAIGNYSDGTAQNLTSWVTWGSTSGATITTAGLLTGVAGGTNATITATMSGVSQSVVVPVRLPGGIATTASISVVTSN